MASLPYDPNKYGKNTMGSGSGPIPPFRNWKNIIYLKFNQIFNYIIISRN